MGACIGRQKKIVGNINAQSFIKDNQILDRLTEHQVQYLNRKYQEYLTTGSQDKRGLLQLFPGIKNYPSQAITKCFSIFSEGSSSIKFRTFCLILAQLLLSSKEDQSIFLFNVFDSDSDNKLSEQELDIFLNSQQSYLRKLSENLSENIKLHKEKFNKIPVEKEDFINWSLRNIELSDLLKPFEIIPSAITEKQTITSKLKNNEYVYLVNSE